MCNTLHKDSKPILPSGYGYKIFSWVDGYLCPITSVWSGIKYKRDAYNKWDMEKCDGFCFLLTLNEAKRLLGDWIPGVYEIRKIHYYGGMGKHDEDFITGKSTYEIALCRAFTILEAVR